MGKGVGWLVSSHLLWHGSKLSEMWVKIGCVIYVVAMNFNGFGILERGNMYRSSAQGPQISEEKSKQLNTKYN